MLQFLSSIIWPPPTDHGKKNDTALVHIETGRASLLVPGRTSLPMPPRPPQRPVACIFYAKEIAAPVFLAVTDEVQRQKLSLLPSAEPSGGTRTTTGVERAQDDGDCVLKLSSLLEQANLVNTVLPQQSQPPASTDEDCVWRAKLDSDTAVVLEVCAIVTDADWDPQKMYILFELDNIAPLQQTRTVLGDRLAVINAAAATKRNGKAAAAKTTCVHNKHPGVLGWCVVCGCRPNTVTLFQSPFSEIDLLKYATEILATTGTHGHIKQVMQQEWAKQRVAAATASDDDNDDITKKYARVDVSAASTLAQDLYQTANGNYEADGSRDGVIFVLPDAWSNAVTQATSRILCNVPFANLDTAVIRVRARSSVSGNGLTHKLKMNIVVQCLGVRD